MADSKRAGSAGTEGRMSTPDLSQKAEAYKTVRRNAIILGFFLLLGCVLFPVAGFQTGGWPTAAIYAMAVSLALLAHTDQTERDLKYFQGRPCTRSSFTGSLRVFLALCAIMVPVLGYVGGGWLHAVIYGIYAILILCCFIRAEKLRHMNATVARVDPNSRENMAAAIAEGSSTLMWWLSLGWIKWGGATLLTKSIFWLFIALIPILAGLVAYACQHLPAQQQPWPFGAACYTLIVLLRFYCDVSVARQRGDRFF